MKLLRRLLWFTVLVCLGLTWLPYFGIFNSPRIVGFLPEPLALTLACNVVLTLCVIALYPLYFKPFVRTLRRQPVIEEKTRE